MKKLSSIAAAIIAVCLVALPLASAQGQKAGKAKATSTEEQIETLQAETIQADLKADTGFLEKYYADDATIIHGIAWQKHHQTTYQNRERSDSIEESSRFSAAPAPVLEIEKRDRQ